MPTCPKCGTLNSEDAVFCSNCGSALGPQESVASPSSQSTPSTWSQSTPSSSPSSSYPPATDKTRTYAMAGIVSAVIGLLLLPEIFGAAAIILGAYTWKNRQGNLGFIVLILGIIFMIVGIEVTALIG